MCLHYQMNMFILLNHKIIKIRLRLDNNFGRIMQSNNSVVGRLSDHFIIPIFLELLKYYFLFQVKKEYTYIIQYETGVQSLRSIAIKYVVFNGV